MNEIAKYLTKSQMSNNDIQQVIQLIDQESANSIYRRCAEEFDFRIVEIEGNAYSITRELTSVLGYSNQEAVSKVISKHGVETLSVSGFIQNGQIQIRQAFGLSLNDHKTRLIDYHGFLTVALEGRGSACDKVREYLLAMEKKARVDTVVYETTGMGTADFQEVGQYIDDPMVQNMLESQKRMKDIIQLRVQQLETQKRVKAIETTIEAELSITPQQEHLLNLRKEELISLQVRNGKDKSRAYQHFWRTVKDRFKFGIWTGLERSKFPLVMEYVDGLILQEQAKLSQLSLFQPIVTYPPLGDYEPQVR